MTTLDDIQDCENELDALRGKFLTQRGWEYKCDLPGSLWLWQKEFAGRLVATGTETALYIEDFFDQVNGSPPEPPADPQSVLDRKPEDERERGT